MHWTEIVAYVAAVVFQCPTLGGALPSFDAATVVEPMDYDFTKFGGRKGDIPEPNEDQVISLYSSMDELVKELAGEFVQLPKNPSATELVDSLNQLTMSESYKPMLDGMTVIYARVCSDTPSEEELRQLPPRIRALFFQWVAKQLRPELDAVDSKSQRRPLRIAQGG
jgi:hypothetical protein